MTHGHVYCTAQPQHGPGQHSADCMPSADVTSPELRLLRAIFGLCAECDRTDEHDHDEHAPAIGSTLAPRRKPRIGPVMRELIAVISAKPGLTRSAALRLCGLPTSGRGSGRSLDAAIGADLVIEDTTNPYVRKGHYSLFASQRDRRIYYLRMELLHGAVNAARADQLCAEIDALCAQQAATWIEGQS